jgi:hypothetical protein
MCEIIKTGMHTDKGFKEVHLTAISKALFEHCRAEVTSTQVYNHVRKWRMRWIHVSKLRDLSGAQWDENGCIIMLEVDHYQGHIMVSTFVTSNYFALVICSSLTISSTLHCRPSLGSPKDSEFLNKPIVNYHEMHTIFVGGISTCKFAMGTNEPLGTPSPPLEEGVGTYETKIIINDGSNKDATAPTPGGKRKRDRLSEDELHAFSSMTEAVKDVADQAIRDNKPTNVHLDFYQAIMSIVEYSEEALMAVLSHLINHKAQGSNFVSMGDNHRSPWLKNYMSKHYYTV